MRYGWSCADGQPQKDVGTGPTFLLIAAKPISRVTADIILHRANDTNKAKV